jgi:phosphomannomutase
VKDRGPLSKALSEYLNFFVSKSSLDYPSGGVQFSELVKWLKNEMPNTKYVELGDIKFVEKEGWVLIRASKTQPIIRIVAEARQQIIANKLLHRYESLVKRRLDFAKG